MRYTPNSTKIRIFFCLGAVFGIVQAKSSLLCVLASPFFWLQWLNWVFDPRSGSVGLSVDQGWHT